MKEALLCKFCKSDPFEYITVDGKKLAVAISCCEEAVNQYYQGLTKLVSDNGVNFLNSGNAQDG